MDLKQKTLKKTEGGAETNEDLKSTNGGKGSSAGFKKGILITVGVGIAAFLVVASIAFFKDKGETKVVDKPSGESTQAVGSSVEATSEVEGGTSEETVVTGDGGEDKPWLSASVDGGGESQSTEETKPAGNKTEPPSKFTPGITDPSQNQYVKNYTGVESDSFVKDLNGKKVPENYNIGDIKTVVDFVSYKKKRAVTAAGVELYWLDATYKGRKAKIQVPFRIFKELDPVGVTVVDVEITYVPNDDPSKEPAEIATFFNVREDYKQVLEQQANNSGGW